MNSLSSSDTPDGEGCPFFFARALAPEIIRRSCMLISGQGDFTIIERFVGLERPAPRGFGHLAMAFFGPGGFFGVAPAHLINLPSGPRGGVIVEKITRP
jgi:hypothetical protein